MARPTKQGIDYFPLDCQFDDKIEMYLIEKGGIGLSVLISIWQMIYSNEGYYINNGKDLHLLIKRKINIEYDEIVECINICLDRNIFNRFLHNKYNILTSKAIQKRYFDAAKKKKIVKIIKEIILIDVSDCNNLINIGINSIDSCENTTNVNVNVKENVDIKENNNVALSSADIKSEILKIANKNKNNKSDKSFIIDLLKKIGMPGNIALEYTNKYPCEYLLRKIFLLEYYKNNTPGVRNDIAWIRSAIEYDNEKFPEHDEFFQWFKSRKEKIMDNDKTPHQLKQIIGRS